MLAALVLLLGACTATPDDPTITYDQLFKWGKGEYTMENWYDCVAYMKRAIEDYKYYKDEVLWCREMCFRQLPPYTESDGPQVELAIFHRFTERALCLVRCKLDRFGSLRPPHEVDPEVDEAFAKRKPYHYMQFCHWKLNDLENAVKAAYTFLIANPDDQMMGENLGYYATLPKYSPKMLVDLEEAPYQKLYLAGVQAYEEEDWVQVIDKLERSLEEYWIADEMCRLGCQSSVDWSALEVAPEYFVFIASMHAAVLRCIRDCPKTLDRIRGKYLNDFLPSHYNYLQFAYWKANRGRNACQSVGTYLLFEPDDEAMLENKIFYENSFATKDQDLFIPTNDAMAYIKRLKLEARSLQFVEERFKFVDGVLPSERVDDRKPLDIAVPEIDIYQQTPSTQDAESTKVSSKHSSVKVSKSVEKDENALKSTETAFEPEMDRLERLQLQKGVQLVKKERELKGDLRFFADKVLTRAECDALLQLEVYLLEEDDRTDLSHPVHADNCILRENGCVKEQPAMVWRDYSAILYLNDANDHFDGGQFIFTDDDGNVQAEVRPVCGRMVGFSGETLHGVRAVRRGTRCVLAMWMTLDEEYHERERLDAQQRLAHIELRSAQSDEGANEYADVL
uniref:Fe2OG dioxygenase domain-containing protein n=1 Tax=Plectus sambesii TaxID=2011161 RepID=A0A914VDP6_9BILA